MNRDTRLSDVLHVLLHMAHVEERLRERRPVLDDLDHPALLDDVDPVRLRLRRGDVHRAREARLDGDELERGSSGTGERRAGERGEGGGEGDAHRPSG